MEFIAIHLTVLHLVVAMKSMYQTTPIQVVAVMLHQGIHTKYQLLLMDSQFSLVDIKTSKLLKLKYI
jgi:hypothetical protein